MHANHIFAGSNITIMTFLHTAVSHDGLPLVVGFTYTVMHVITGPDHMAAVLPMAIENKKKSWGIGLSWGFGHLVGMLLIGMLYLFLKSLMTDETLEIFSSYSELMVGVILIFIGLWAFYKLYRGNHRHQHPHKHKGEEKDIVHVHPHDHTHDGHQHQHQKLEKQNVFASFSIGTLHGFAGIAHFILFGQILTYGSTRESLMYLGGFAGGTLVAMTGFAFLVGMLAYSSNRGHDDRLFKIIRITGASIAIIVGIIWIIQTQAS